MALCIMQFIEWRPPAMQRRGMDNWGLRSRARDLLNPKHFRTAEVYPLMQDDTSAVVLGW
eukprot:CAMPEP_0194406944 /NCGR_PEP_ID=MMETSP0176-20130528/5013_1 /TAXON_ID=216777 /ORGANISM="Proboscia alata, Strain PI-D3" /LENGTH=59 /DNA_ID=CAMNT_0039206319 /DNA_START=68 /DNA_END=244 /DNA_ORIENTATION=+